MKIEHIALWVDDLEKMKTFYETYFGLRAGEKYNNTIKPFSSYFLQFGESKTRLELMHKSGIEPYSGLWEYRWTIRNIPVYRFFNSIIFRSTADILRTTV